MSLGTREGGVGGFSALCLEVGGMGGPVVWAD